MMTPSPLAIAYFIALVAGASISWVFGRKSERVFMALIFIEWALTYATWLHTKANGLGVPVLPFLCIDALIALLMIYNMTREWQLTVIRLAILHVVIHMSFFLGVSFTDIPPTNRPYSDITTALGYMEIAVTAWASINHEWRSWLDPKMARHRYRAILPRLAFFHRRPSEHGERKA